VNPSLRLDAGQTQKLNFTCSKKIARKEQFTQLMTTEGLTRDVLRPKPISMKKMNLVVM